MNPCSIFKALAEDTRIRIMVLLSEAELCVGELVELLQCPQSNVSRHLRILSGARLVSCRREAQFIYYRMNPELHEAWPAMPPLILSLGRQDQYLNLLASLDRYRETNATDIPHWHRPASGAPEDDLI